MNARMQTLNKNEVWAPRKLKRGTNRLCEDRNCSINEREVFYYKDNHNENLGTNDKPLKGKFKEED